MKEKIFFKEDKYCMSNYENVKNFRVRLKERAVYVLGDKC